MLNAIPKHWASMGRPLLEGAGWSPFTIPADLTRDDVQTARAFITRLASSPAAERQSLIQSELNRRQVKEIDLWLPELVVKEFRNDTPHAALLIEAWLEWAAALRRRDVLLVAASYAIELAVRHQGIEVALPVTRIWVDLPCTSCIRGRARLLRDEGLFLYFSGKHPQALKVFGEAQSLFHDAADSLGEGDALIAKADALLFLGHAESALTTLRTARALYALTDNAVGEGNAFNLEGDIQDNLGEHETAVDSYRKAIFSFQKAGSEQGLTIVLSDLGDALAPLGRYDEAIDAYRQARILLAGVGDPLDLANTWQGEADALLLAGHYRQAIAAYETAFMQHASAGNELGQGIAYRGKAQALLQIQDWKGAARAARISLRYLRRFDSLSAKIIALTVRGIAEENLGRRRAAAAAATEAIRLHARWRATRMAELNRSIADLDIAGSYGVLIAIRARQRGHAEAALELAEQARSRVLLDLLVSEPRDESRSAVGLIGEQQRIQAELADLESLAAGSQSLAFQQHIAEERRHLVRKLEWNRYEILASQEGVLRTAEPLDTAAVRALSRDTGPILLYYVADSEIFAFLVQPGAPQVRVHTINLTRNQVHKKIHELSYQLANPLGCGSFGTAKIPCVFREIGRSFLVEGKDLAGLMGRREA